MIISKELVCEVLDIDERLCRLDKLIDNTLFFYTLNNTGEDQHYINTYEFAHKCKEWAYKQGFLIGSNCRNGVTVTDINTYTILNHFDVDFEDFTEFEIKACQWLFDNKRIEK